MVYASHQRITHVFQHFIATQEYVCVHWVPIGMRRIRFVHDYIFSFLYFIIIRIRKIYLDKTITQRERKR